MEKKQAVALVAVFAVGVLVGVGVEEYREHAVRDAVTTDGMQVYAYPAWGVSVRFPSGYAPRLVQDEDAALGLRIMQQGSGRAMEELTGEEDCTICAVSVSIVKDFLRDESGMIVTPEEYRANQQQLGVTYEDVVFAGHPALLRTDPETGRRDYSIFMKTETGYDWCHVGVHVDDPEAERIAATFTLSN